MITKYYAFDGTEFDNADECLDYEGGFGRDFSLYDVYGPVKDVSETSVINIHTEKGIELLKEFARKFSAKPNLVEPINHTGIWMWSFACKGFAYVPSEICEIVAKIRNKEWK